MNPVWILAIMVVGCILLPPTAYFTCKLAAAGWLRGRQYFERWRTR